MGDFHLEQEMKWQDDLNSALKTWEDLNAFFGPGIPKITYPVLIPKPFAEKIKLSGPGSVLWDQFIPRNEEMNTSGLPDPIGDQDHLKAPQLIHRYRNRALFLPTSRCPIICRYCFRKNELVDPHDLFAPKFQETLKYLQENPEIEEIIFSGGDPLILGDKKIAYYLSEFSRIPSIKFIRFHTRTPVVLPSRITPDFLMALKEAKGPKILFALHINHPNELDREVRDAILKLKDFPLFSQTVLLRGINDHPEILKSLLYDFISLNIRPYYLHHPDKVKGGMHFYLGIPEGRKIYSKLRDEVPGWGIFHYVVDIPGGKGKTPAFNPETWEFKGRLLGKDGEYHSY
jgi:lysine 2,3-aminomutase